MIRGTTPTHTFATSISCGRRRGGSSIVFLIFNLLFILFLDCGRKAHILVGADFYVSATLTPTTTKQGDTFKTVNAETPQTTVNWETPIKL